MQLSMFCVEFIHLCNWFESPEERCVEQKDRVKFRHHYNVNYTIKKKTFIRTKLSVLKHKVYLENLVFIFDWHTFQQMLSKRLETVNVKNLGQFYLFLSKNFTLSQHM